MQAREYIRSVYKDLMREQRQGLGNLQGAFLAAAIEVVHGIESPLKEETLVRLAVLEVESERGLASPLQAAG